VKAKLKAKILLIFYNFTMKFALYEFCEDNSCAVGESNRGFHGFGSHLVWGANKLGC
jgi:hypothetical protein